MTRDEDRIPVPAAPNPSNIVKRGGWLWSWRYRMSEEAQRPPWEYDSGGTNVDGFLAAYAEDDNTFWRADIGHIQNVLDELIIRAREANDDE